MLSRGEKGFSLLDTKKRVAYAAKALNNTTLKYWTDNVLLYLDAVSFAHKRNSYQGALAPAARAWRTRGEALELTAEGNKDVRRGNIRHFVVGISFGVGAVLVEEYTKMNGQYFSHVLKLHCIVPLLASCRNREGEIAVFARQ